jgi:hypothetical protein
MKERKKHCEVCSKYFSKMFRVQYKNTKKWVFVCKDSLLTVKKDNPAYSYGGTWKK